MAVRMVLFGAVMALGACNTADYFGEAGQSLERTGFGQSTARNMGLQSGEINAVIDLSRRFAAEVPSTINFAFNSAVLDGDARATLDQQADWIRQFPEIRFRVYGHTDLVGSDAYNQRLGQRRANAAVNYLVSRGISRSRLEAVASFGETRPLVVSAGPERRNRRTVTEVTGFVRGRGADMNGKYAAVVFREYVKSAQTAHPDVTSGNAQVGQLQ
ncbi:peptidoglycan-associated lipoprotein [Rhodobacteraceae bacterium MBR-64]|jgi:outer membrane protein OmpA-like peptidoglycan-associated protein